MDTDAGRHARSAQELNVEIEVVIHELAVDSLAASCAISSGVFVFSDNACKPFSSSSESAA